MYAEVRLRWAIKKCGKIYFALVQQTGGDVGVIVRFVRGERDLRLATAAKLANELGLDLRDRSDAGD
jgi:hypothetical protein